MGQKNFETIHVLSVQQPHADLIINGAKWCENRSWQTHYRGELFIHASRIDAAEMKAWRDRGIDPVEASPLGCKTGHIIGSVELLDCVDIEDMLRIERWIQANAAPEDVEERWRPLVEVLRDVDVWSWDHVLGDWCWILADPQPLDEPFPAKGKLNVWTMEIEVEREDG